MTHYLAESSETWELIRAAPPYAVSIALVILFLRYIQRRDDAADRREERLERVIHSNTEAMTRVSQAVREAVREAFRDAA